MSARHDRHLSRRSFLKATTALAGMSPLIGFPVRTGSAQAAGPLLAYVGTFSSPLRDTLPTQVDLPPGNGRGIHLFHVDRTSGAMTPSGIVEMGTSPSCLALNAAGTRLYSANETDRVGDDKEGTASAFVINRTDGRLQLLNTVRTGGRGPTYVSVHPGGPSLAGRQLLRWFRGSAADTGRWPAWRRLGCRGRCRHDRPHARDARPIGQLRGEWPRSHPRPYDPRRSVRPFRAARRPWPGQDLHLALRRSARRADPERSPFGCV